jgi:hypothetical protein
MDRGYFKRSLQVVTIRNNHIGYKDCTTTHIKLFYPQRVTWYILTVKICTNANTDNKGKLLVTVFAPPWRDLPSASSLRSVRRYAPQLLILHPRQISNARKPGHPPLHPIKILYQDSASWRTMVFAPDSYREPPIQLYSDITNPAHLSGLRHLDNFIVTPNPRPSIGPDSYRDLQKHMPTRRPRLNRGRLPATKLNRRAVSGKLLAKSLSLINDNSADTRRI